MPHDQQSGWASRPYRMRRPCPWQHQSFWRSLVIEPVELSTAVLAIWSARPVAHHRGLVGQLGPPLLDGGRIAMP